MKAEFCTPMSKKRESLRNLLPLEAPLSLFIDPSDACNFKCQFCFQSKTMKQNNHLMDKGLFDKIADDMASFEQSFKMVHLHGFGEPLLNPNLIYFVKTLKSRGLAEKVQITTNGSMLTREISQQLIAAGIDSVVFSIYALDDDGYYRFSSTKTKFDDIYKNMRDLYDIRGNCHLHAKIAGDYFTEDEQTFFLNKFGDISDTIFIDHAINQWPGLNVTENINRHIYFDKASEKICPMPFYQMVIHSNGLVSPCCVDYNEDLIVGDIRSESLQDIWLGEQYNSLRRKILGSIQDNNNYAVCGLCQYPALGATVDITPYREELKKIY